jgi:hypothetical protein
MEKKKHFSPLNCTFLHCISKMTNRKQACYIFFNEIKDLAPLYQAIKRQNRSKLST